MDMQLTCAGALQRIPVAAEILLQLGAQVNHVGVVQAVTLGQKCNAADEPQGVGIFGEAAGGHQCLAFERLLRLRDGELLDFGLGFELG